MIFLFIDISQLEWHLILKLTLLLNSSYAILFFSKMISFLKLHEIFPKTSYVL